MKIVYIIDRLTAGGKERQLLELIKGLHKKHEIAVLVLFNEIEYEEFIHLPIELQILNGSSPRNNVKVAKKIYSFCKKFKPDIIHSFELSLNFLSIPTSKLQRIPLINGALRGLHDHKRGSKRHLFSKMNYVLSSRIISNSIAGLHAINKTPNHKFKVVYNGFDLKRLERILPKEQVISKYQIKHSFLIGMVANYTDPKEYILFYEVARQMEKKFPDIGFISVGNGKHFEWHKNLQKDLTNIYMLGAQSDVESIVNIMDIGVLLSKREGISNAIMEYMAFSKPVVASYAGGNNEIVLHQKTGLLLDGDVTEVQDNLIYLYENNDVANKYGSQGRIRIEEKFSLSAMIDSTETIYQGTKKSR